MCKTDKSIKNERLRRTRLYIPGNNPAMIQNASIYGADSLIFDLEDSVPLAEKDSTRLLVRNALKQIDFGDCEVTIRINARDTDFFEQDLEAVIPVKIDGILLPKTESLEDITILDKIIAKLEKEHNIPVGHTKIMPLIETALGVLHLEEIAFGPRVAAIGLGGEDLAADIGAKRTKGGLELEYVASRLLIVCAASKTQAIDTVYADINDPEGLYQLTKQAIDMGFQGKSIIHPSQVEPVHKAFLPSAKEVEQAKRIIKAYREATKKGLGAVSVDGRMVDVPVVMQAELILKRATAAERDNKQ